MSLASGIDTAAPSRGVPRILTETAARMSADRWLYAVIALYTFLGLLFLHLAGATDRAAYEPYFLRWLLLFGFTLPAVALLIELGLVLHRFDRRRGLALRRAFSPRRLGHFAAGLVLVMAMVFFQGTITSVKNAVFVWQGSFPYDRAQADIDAALHFGIDPWRLLHAVAGSDFARTVIEFNYNVLWFVICFGALFFVLTSPKTDAIRARYLFTFIAVWIVLGNVLAGLFLSAGPAFYGSVTGDTARFSEQIAFLARSAASPNSAAAYQDYLWTLHSSGQPGFGSGIAAFPSVHVGLITLNALFVWERSRRWGALVFCYVAFVTASSVYLAWHYAIDGYAAIVVVIAIYLLVRRLLPDRIPVRAS